jgi:hypothetical protein
MAVPYEQLVQGSRYTARNVNGDTRNVMLVLKHDDTSTWNKIKKMVSFTVDGDPVGAFGQQPRYGGEYGVEYMFYPLQAFSQAVGQVYGAMTDESGSPGHGPADLVRGYLGYGKRKTTKRKHRRRKSRKTN